MSYEKLGMGWSDMPTTTGWWIFEKTTYPRCEHIPGVNGVKKCFTDDPADIRCAQYSGCVNTNTFCETVRGTPGMAYCCPPNLPPPPEVARCVPEDAPPAATAQGGLECSFNHVLFSSLGTNARARAIWTVQNKLCQLGIDPGPVDGTENDQRYRSAIRAFQLRNSIPVTGEPDAVTLRAMGLENAPSLAAAIGASSISPSFDFGTTNLLPFLMIGAFGLSGMFLFYAMKKYKRSTSLSRNPKDSEVRETLKKHGISLPPKDLILKNARYVMSRDDWYVQEEGGDWYYYTKGKWQFLPYGPMDMNGG